MVFLSDDDEEEFFLLVEVVDFDARREDDVNNEDAVRAGIIVKTYLST